MKKLSIILILFFSCSKESVNDNNECDNNYDPPFGVTIFIDPDIIREDDPTTFVSLSYAGTGKRQMYDRRTGWVNLEPCLFPAEYDDGLSIEIQVNPEFGSPENAQIYALKYAEVIGRLTTELRKDVQTSWIHRGDEPFGGGNNTFTDNDWTCNKCNNVNFSFRKECNRCGEPKQTKSDGHRKFNGDKNQKAARHNRNDGSNRKLRKARGKSSNHAHNRGPQPLNARARKRNRDD